MENLEFEKAFEQLENILEKLNTNEVKLEESIQLFEKANGLIQHCSKKLSSAEKKVEILLKDRNNQLIIENNEPKKEPFTHSSEDIFSNNSGIKE